ncbi:ROK family protein [Cereibacter johrii]|uniref:N-acetylglucosamine kinase n=1 Tax=Cereibacter johrii TaxID=445629 RepID=A0ABX5J4F9_9RHOB|nr:ROK family protein [Cereibacter johrii]ODM43720.1 N-acetylglucosamine kinase [Cereibacter johrii]PTM77493.1 N-acetylglucosamine kinase [Cereibacter johrii]
MLIAFDIGGSRIRAARAFAPDDLEPLGERPMPASFPGFVAALRGLVPEEGTSLAIAIAGVVDPDTGRITAANLPAVNGRALAADLGAALGRPVWIGNDADCFVLTEALLGVGRGHRNVFGIILGSGVGGGIVLEGRLLTGAGGIAGEWGHAPVLDQRPLGRDLPHLTCGCGQSGCVDTYGSARGIERLHLALSGQGLDSREILAAWRAGEMAAAATVEVWLELVAGPLAMLVNVIGPSVVPVGGGLSNDRDLMAALDRAVRHRLLRPTPEALLRPAFHPEPGLVGAALAGLQAFG